MLFNVLFNKDSSVSIRIRNIQGNAQFLHRIITICNGQYIQVENRNSVQYKISF